MTSPAPPTDPPAENPPTRRWRPWRKSPDAQPSPPERVPAHAPKGPGLPPPPPAAPAPVAAADENPVIAAKTPPETDAANEAPTKADRSSWQGVWSVLQYVVVAGLAYVPLLAVKPGIVTSDTKTYLYLDPSQFLRQVATMWNPTVALGTVTHEYVGYLWPMGPFYALSAALHVPTWVAQRLWLGTILFFAGAGILYLCRVLSVRGPGPVVGGLAYMLSPYFLQYAGRISVILLPWAGLPWMVAFAVLALRRGGWRYPALFALVVATVSGINASSILYVGIAPVLWLIYAVAVEREGTWTQALVAALKIGVLTLGACLWWMAGLQLEAAYGVDVLRYTETVPSTSSTSSASEVVRGLGYWYFYGSDRLGPWTAASVLYTQQLWLLAASFAVPVVAFLAAVFTRWRHRAYFVLLVVVGVTLSVGAHPFDSPTPVGGLLKRFMSDTTAGLAMRSTDRATPLILLGLAMLLAAGVSAAWRRIPVAGALSAVAIVALVIANNPAVFNGDAEVASFFVQPASLPSYEMAAINHLNATHLRTRVLAIPGNDFASYRWGDTVDTPQPAFLTRPFVTREQQVMGSMPTADLLYAVDGPIQTGTQNWSGLAPMARLMSAGDVLVEYDQAYEHYGTPQPQILAASLATTPAGLTDPLSFGTPAPNVSSFPTLDEQDLASTPNPHWPSPLVDYTVTDPWPITRAESDQGSVIVAGDETGLQDLANLGLLDTDSAIYFSGTLDAHHAQLKDLAGAGATLVVTDTNRKQGFRWDTLTANAGYTETPTDNPAKTDPSDSPINLFAGAPSNAKTVAQYVGAADVTASSYGNTVSYTPANRPYSAVDDNPDTAWETGIFLPSPAGQWWQIDYGTPAPADEVTLTQPQPSGPTPRHITKVTLTFDGGHPVTADLTAASLSAGGQTISFPQRSFTTLRITIDATSDDHQSYATAGAVGLTQVTVPGRSVLEAIKMPGDLLDATGAASLGDRLVLSMSRELSSPYPPKSDTESTMTREFTLPTARTFSLTGTAAISSLIPDDEIDRLVGLPGATGKGVVAYSNGRLPGDLKATAAAAADGNLATAWQPGLGAAHQAGDWLEYNVAHTLTFSTMDLAVEADGRHSVPTAITVTAENATQVVTGTRTLALPPIVDQKTAGSTVSVPLSFPSLTGRRFKITFTHVRLEHTTNYYSSNPIALPLGIAEVGIPGLTVPAVPATVPGGCQMNLLRVDGRPVGVRVTGSTASAVDGGTLGVSLCGPDAAGITLAAGPHVVQTAVAHTPSTTDCMKTENCNGWNLNQLVLDSAAGGGPEPLAAGGALSAPSPGAAPAVTTSASSATGEVAHVSGANSPFELVFGQSIDAGWHAEATPGPGAPPGSHRVDLGAPQLVDGFANGWPVTAADLAALGTTSASSVPFTVTLTWAPQREEDLALALSAATVVLCLLLAVFPRRWWGALRRRARRRPRHAARFRRFADQRGRVRAHRCVHDPPRRPRPRASHDARR